MKIVHIIQALTLGGAARSMIATSKYSARLGNYQHSIVALHSCEPPATKLAQDSGIHEIYCSPELDELRSIVEDADIVQVHWWNTPEVFDFLLSDLPPCRLVLWYHVAGDGSPHIITEKLAAFADVNIACNPWTYHELSLFASWSDIEREHHLAMVYDAADFERIREVEPKPHNGFNVGYIGTVDYYKMHPRYLYMSASARIPNKRFVVCGTGEPEALQREAREHGIDQYFDIKGWVDDINPVLAEMDVYGYPLCENTYAAAELNLQEVMVCGIPPIVFPYGGVKRLVQHNQTGLVVHSEQEYTDALELLYRDSDLRLRLGENARNYALQHFGAENAARDLVRVYDKLAARKKRSRRWGENIRESQINSSPLYSDIDHNDPGPLKSEVFVDSLGEHGEMFRISMGSYDPEVVINAEMSIASCSPLVAKTGIEMWRALHESDPWLRLWMGLLEIKRGRYERAAHELSVCVELGLKHWRVYWYLERCMFFMKHERHPEIVASLQKQVPKLHEITRRFMDEFPQPMSQEIANSVPMPSEVPTTHEVLCTVIVSTYAGAEFIVGCLQDLLRQTLYRDGHMRILIIDAHSPENEQELCREVVQAYPHVDYVRTDQRENLYASWNRGSEMATTPFIANANVDDRRDPECYERLVRAAQAEQAGVAYSDIAFTKQPNEFFETASKGYWKFSPFSAYNAVHWNHASFCFLWSKAAWKEVEGFDAEQLELAADFDFATRVGLKFGAAYVDAPLTLALLHDKQQSKREDRMNSESDKIREAFCHMTLEELLPNKTWRNDKERADEYVRFGVAALKCREPWYGPDAPAVKTRSAALWLSRAVELYPNHAVGIYNLALVGGLTGRFADATEMLKKALEFAPGIVGEKYEQAQAFLQAYAAEQSVHVLMDLPVLELEESAESTQAVVEQHAEQEIQISNTAVPKTIPRFEQFTGPAKRIVFFTYSWDSSGGGTTFPKSVAHELVRRGNEVFVISAEGEDDRTDKEYAVKEFRDGKVTVFGIFNRDTTFADEDNPQREVYDPLAVRAIARLLEDIKPDVAHIHNFLGLSFSLIDECARRDIPMVYTPHNYHVLDPSLYVFNPGLENWRSSDFFENSYLVEKHPDLIEDYRTRMTFIREKMNAHVDLIAAVSNRQKQLLVGFGIKEEKIAVIHQVNEQATAVAERARPHNHHTPLRVGFFGSIMPHKGPHMLIAAAQTLDPSLVEVHMHGYVDPRFKKQLDEVDVNQVVHYKGAYSQKDLPAIASELDVAVIPSVWEDCAPLVLAECTAMCLPMVAADIGGISDFVFEGMNGLLYPHDRPDKLAEILRALAASPELVDQMALNCQLSHGFDTYCTHMENVYEQLTHRVVEASNVELLYGHDNAASEEPIKQMSPVVDNVKDSEDPKEVQMPNSIARTTGFSGTPATGKMPETLPTPLYLNLGCGNDIREGFVNIDLYSDDPTVVRMDIRALELPDNSVDAILASDVLEHFSHRETAAVLKEWTRVLKPGGELVLRCPSLRLQVESYMRGEWDADVASYMIFGGQTNPGDYHCIAFDEKSITKHVQNAGLVVASFEEQEVPQTQGFCNQNMVVRCRKPEAPQTSGNNIHALSDRVHVVWEGTQFRYHSFSNINRNLCLNVMKVPGAELTVVPFEDDQFDPKNNEKFAALQQQDVRYKGDIPHEVRSLPAVWVRHTWPPKAERPEGKWVIMQPWELSELREDFVDIMNSADEVWTPSTWCRNVYIHSGVDADKIQVIPNGVDSSVYTPHGPVASLPIQKRFVFLFVGGTIQRKGIDVLLESYTKAFSSKDDVCLLVKDMGGDRHYKGQTAKEMIDSYRRSDDYPEILYIDEYLDESEMAALYRAADVLVVPYRGEGFCMPALEAMASGLPVIATAGGATDDFVDESVGWTIPAGREYVGSAVGEHKLTGNAYFLEPDTEALSDCMQQAYKDPGSASYRGTMGMLRAHTQWTWNRAAQKMMKRIDKLAHTAVTASLKNELSDVNSGCIEFALAERAFFEADVDEAIQHYKNAVEMRGLTEDYAILAIHRLASVAVMEDQLEMASDFIAKVKNESPNHPDTLYIEALIQSMKGRWDEVMDSLAALLDMWRTERFRSRIGIRLDDILAALGRAHFECGFNDDARKIYELSLGENPENADACFGAGQCFIELEMWEEAKLMLDFALQYRPGFEAAEAELEEVIKRL